MMQEIGKKNGGGGYEIKEKNRRRKKRILLKFSFLLTVLFDFLQY